MTYAEQAAHPEFDAACAAHGLPSECARLLALMSEHADLRETAIAFHSGLSVDQFRAQLEADNA